MIDFLKDNAWPLVLFFAVSTAIFSALIFLAFPAVVRRLPENFFVDDQAELRNKSLFALIGRNLLGGMMIIAGPIVMLPLFTLPPGSGLVVMVVGIGIMDFKGKRKVLRKFLRFAKVRKLLNWMRLRSGLKPFELPEECAREQEKENLVHQNKRNGNVA